jgi:hypothetical protein
VGTLTMDAINPLTALKVADLLSCLAVEVNNSPLSRILKSVLANELKKILKIHQQLTMNMPRRYCRS